MSARRLRVYLDTSVIGGLLDEEWSKDTSALLDDIRSGTLEPVVSDVVQAEVAKAPVGVQEVLLEVERLGAEVVTIGEQASELAFAYVRAGVVTEKYIEDALHIAVATIARVDVLVSWNFKHIVNLRRIRAFNGVNLLHGYPNIEVRSPREVLSSGHEQD